MAVTTYTRDVNGGATGWTKTQVMDSLGLIFSDLGFVSTTGTGFLHGDSVTEPTNTWSAVGGTVTGLSATTYYFYDVPASGGRSGGTFRITRNSSGVVTDVRTHFGSWDTDSTSYPEYANLTQAAMGEGWSDNEAFTIPASATGGSANGATDIVFGSVGATTPAVSVYQSNPSSSPWFYSRDDSYNWDLSGDNPVRFAKVVNDANKTWGTTYWMFRMNTYRGSKYIDLGCAAMFDAKLGKFGGIAGLHRSGYTFIGSHSAYEWGADLSYPTDPGSSYYGTPGEASNIGSPIRYCADVSPTSYPLTITAHTDGNGFAVISFSQDISGTTTTFGTFWMYKGTNIYNGLVDLDYLVLDAWGPIGSETSNASTYQSMGMGFGLTKRNETGGTMYPVHDNNQGHKAFASAVLGNRLQSTYEPYSQNIFSGTTESDKFYYPHAVWEWYMTPIRSETVPDQDLNYKVLYLRDTASDTNSQLDAATDFYRPATGIPLTTALLPIPGYYPDDFALIPFEVSPAASTFYKGDTITVSGSEVYTVITVSYRINEDSLYSRGIAFCARTT